MPTFTALQQSIRTAVAGMADIPEARKASLEKLAAYLKEKKAAGQVPSVNFICTHNSRRSQIAQLWLLAASSYFDLGEVKAFSGGTEGTAFNHHAVAATRRAGFELEQVSEGENPHYLYRSNGHSLELWSKVFSEAPNPSSGFAAVMVCSEADEACPFVPGAEKRISLPFQDPKASDGSGREEEAYDEACRLIGREICYAVKMAV